MGLADLRPPGPFRVWPRAGYRGIGPVHIRIDAFAAGDCGKKKVVADFLVVCSDYAADSPPLYQLALNKKGRLIPGRRQSEAG